MNCSLAQALEIVGEWWSLLILREALLFGATRFGEFREPLGIADNILSERLRRLTATGIFDRVRGGAGRDEYRLTEMGRSLFPVVMALMQWGDRWAPQARGIPVKAIEKSSGEEIPPVTVRNSRGRALTPTDIKLAAGPGANAGTRARLSAQISND